jgi:hypothetical protein
VSFIPPPITSRRTSPFLRAERHADADFLAALRDAVSHHAVDADRREQQGDAGEDGEEAAAFKAWRASERAT